MDLCYFFLGAFQVSYCFSSFNEDGDDNCFSHCNIVSALKHSVRKPLSQEPESPISSRSRAALIS